MNKDLFLPHPEEKQNGVNLLFLYNICFNIHSRFICVIGNRSDPDIYWSLFQDS